MTDLHSWFFISWLFFYLSICKCNDIIVESFEGESATLSCKYDSRYHGKCEICWMKGVIPTMGCGDEIIGSDGDRVVRRKSGRYQLEGDIQHGDVSLTIRNVQIKDSGKYGCRIHVPGLFNDEMYYVHLFVKETPIPTTQEPVAVTTIFGLITTESQTTQTARETDTTQDSSSIFNSSSIPESTTIALWPSNSTQDNSSYVDYHESSFVENRESKVNTSAVIVPLLVLLLALIAIAVILIWKQKRKNRGLTEIARDSDNSVIYSNSSSSVGLYNREMAVDNIYHIEPENEYEQWN